MKKLMKQVGVCLILAALVWCGTLIADRQRLREGLIRLHVVANSDSEEDQRVKLQVRDAVTASLQKSLAEAADAEQARAYLQENLSKIQDAANAALERTGFDGEAVVTLCRESFATRHYDTFTLPAGVYETLRVTIGRGEGHNWWCVVFPSLCIPATTSGFADVAAGAGFPDTLSSALAGTEGYEIRFYALDALGKLENIFWQG